MFLLLIGNHLYYAEVKNKPENVYIYKNNITYKYVCIKIAPRVTQTIYTPPAQIQRKMHCLVQYMIHSSHCY